MFRRDLFRCFAVAVLLASLLAPATAAAAPWTGSPAAPGQSLVASIWDFFHDLFLAEMDTGGCIDPDGRNICAGAGAAESGDPGSSLDTRGAIDPNG